MPNKNYLRGRRLEWQVKKDLEKMGYHTMRTSGSHGAFDIVAYITPGSITIVRFIQCKVVKDEKQVPRIIRDAASKANLPHIIASRVIVRPEIAIKIHGNKDYNICTLEIPIDA